MLRGGLGIRWDKGGAGLRIRLGAIGNPAQELGKENAPRRIHNPPYHKNCLWFAGQSSLSLVNAHMKMNSYGITPVGGR